jgi:GNAT superfamily N-acetyltransferase
VLELRPVPDDGVAARRDRAIERWAARRVRISYEDPGEARRLAESSADQWAGQLRYFDVVEDGSVVGSMVWRERGDAAEVDDLVLDEPQRSPELLPALVEMARAAGVASLAVAATPGDAEREALVAVREFVPRATNMALPLDGEIGDPDGLELRAMTQAEFEAYLSGSLEGYVHELAAAGMSEAAAREQGERQFAELIPDGLQSDGQSFFTAWVGDTAVGTLWISTQRPMAFVYDIAVDEAHRRQGYGAAIMNAGARWCRDRGHRALGLNVFAHNPGARALYDKLGYHVTVDFRTLDLGDAS